MGPVSSMGCFSSSCANWISWAEGQAVELGEQRGDDAQLDVPHTGGSEKPGAPVGPGMSALEGERDVGGFHRQRPGCESLEDQAGRSSDS